MNHYEVEGRGQKNRTSLHLGGVSPAKEASPGYDTTQFIEAKSLRRLSDSNKAMSPWLRVIQ